jgi:hypothetical protein
MKKTVLFFIVMIISLQYASAQRQLTGTVRESSTNQPLFGASVTLQGATTGASTNADGKFSITIPEKIKAIVVSFVGYESKIKSLW